MRALAFAVSIIISLAALPLSAGLKGHDASAPIEFTAEKLEVRKNGRVASFAGNVKALQGDLMLRADEIKVFYDGAGEGFGGSVRRIDGNGNVQVRSDEERAQGDWAVYDVPSNIVTLGGQVELARGDTVIRGNRLRINLQTGETDFEALPSAGGQVQGEFAPADRQN